MPTCCSAPRSCMSMNGSPAICSENRVHRAHRMQRSRSSNTCDEILIGLANVRLTSVKRESARPLDIAWFCSGHSPPLSHIGQSSGWLISSSSITPCWALSAASEVSWVRTTMSPVATVVHDASGLRCPSTSTRHWRHAPTGSSSGWSQNRGIWMPISSAARITRVPLGTLISAPSIVSVTISGWRTWSPVWVLAAPEDTVIGASRLSVRREHGLSGVERASASFDVGDVLVAEVLDRRHHRAGRTIAQRAERLPQDRVGDVQQLVEILVGALAGFQPLVDLVQPEGALSARRALPARLVFVELGPPSHRAHHTGGFVEDLQRLGAQHRADSTHSLVVQRHIEVLVGEQRCRRTTGRPELEPVPGAHPAGVVEQLTQRDTQRSLVLTRPGDVSGQRIQREARRFLGAHGPEPIDAVENDRRDTGDRFDVVDHSGAAVEPGYRRERRPEPRLATPALQRIEQRGLLAADVGARAGVYHQLQVEAGSGDIAAQETGGIGLGHRVLQTAQHRQYLTA